MSTCISRHGEYSSHIPDDEHTCTRCGVLDEEGLIAELGQLRAALKNAQANAEVLADEVVHAHAQQGVATCETPFPTGRMGFPAAHFIYPDQLRAIADLADALVRFWEQWDDGDVKLYADVRAIEIRTDIVPFPGEEKRTEDELVGWVAAIDAGAWVFVPNLEIDDDAEQGKRR